MALVTESQDLRHGPDLQSCVFHFLINRVHCMYSNAVMFAANGHFRRMLQGGDETKTLSLGKTGHKQDADVVQCTQMGLGNSIIF